MSAIAARSKVDIGKMIEKEIKVQYPVLNHDECVANIGIDATSIEGNTKIIVQGGYLSTQKALINIFNYGDVKSQMTIVAGDAYPNCMLGDIVVEIPPGISVINLQDLSRFERHDGTAHLVFQEDFKGAIYAIDWQKNGKD